MPKFNPIGTGKASRVVLSVGCTHTRRNPLRPHPSSPAPFAISVSHNIVRRLWISVRPPSISVLVSHNVVRGRFSVSLNSGSSMRRFPSAPFSISSRYTYAASSAAFLPFERRVISHRPSDSLKWVGTAFPSCLMLSLHEHPKW